MQRLLQSNASLLIAPIDVSCSGLSQQNRQLNMRYAANVFGLGEGGDFHNKC
jgi:hypothetical protein